MAAKKKPAAKKAPTKKRARDTLPRNVTKNGSRSNRNADGCTPSEQLFILEYMADKNATQAAIRAGYSPRSAHIAACKLMKRAHIKAGIAARLAKMGEKLEITAERTLLELARVAFFDIRRLFREDGSLKAVHELDADTAGALASIETETRMNGDVATPVTKIKANPKVPALGDLARHFGLFEKDNKQVGDAITELLNAVADRDTGLPVKP